MKVLDQEFQKLFHVMESKRLSPAKVKAMIFARENQLTISESTSFNPENFNLVVDYRKTLRQMVAAGKYGKISREIVNIDLSLPWQLIGAKVEVECKIFHFNHPISVRKAVDEMEKAGYRPATLMELLSFGVFQPKLQKKFPIFAPYSIADDDEGLYRSSLVLGEFASVRVLARIYDYSYHNDDAEDFKDNCRFIGVRK